MVQQELLRAGRLVVMADLSTASAPADLGTRILQGATLALGRRWPDALQWLVQHFGVRIRLVTDPSGLILPAVDVGVREAPADEQRRTLAGALEAIEALARHKRALAVCASGLTTAATRRAFALGPQGTATKAAQALIAQGWLTKDGTAYRYDSPFARGWVILNALADVGLALPVTHLPQAS